MSSKNRAAVHLISSPEDFAGEHDYVQKILEQDRVMFHLRKPRKDLVEMERWLMALPFELIAKVIVHGHPNLLDSLELRGIHYNHYHPIPTVLPTEPVMKGFSAHSLEEIKSLKKLDYCFLSPIFESISKIGYRGTFNLNTLGAELKEIKDQNPQMKIIALSGIQEENVAWVKELGFDGVAVLGRVWNDPDPFAAIEVLLQVCES
jgi:thiamine-phosphate pyrophosphorylase